MADMLEGRRLSQIYREQLAKRRAEEREQQRRGFAPPTDVEKASVELASLAPTA